MFDMMPWKAHVRRIAPYVCLLLSLCLVTTAAAEPELMSDAELEAVTARGTVDEDGTPVLDLGGLLAMANPDGAGALFSFDMGSVLGSGGVDLTGLTGASTLNLNGTLSPALLQVENLNMIFNLNICTSCKADNIYQLGIGVPITLKSGSVP